MGRLALVAVLGWLLLSAHCGAPATVSPATSRAGGHDRTFWRSIAANGYAVPHGESAEHLAGELSELLGSPDPELRDTLAYSILADWITEHRVLKPNDLVGFARTWRANLRDGIGESGTDSALKRTFSALGLASIVERDTREPFLSPGDFRGILDDALIYLGAERDARGYAPTKGWIHATAHTADLLGSLAANGHLARADQAKILTAIATRLEQATTAYIFGEQDRLALAATSLAERADFDAAAFDAFVHQVHDIYRRTRATRPPTLSGLAVETNTKLFLQALFVRLSAASLPPSAVPFRKAVLEVAAL